MNRILVVGVPRSGTTWLAATLAATPRCLLMNEPDNPFFQSEAESSRTLYGGYPVLRPRESALEYQRIWDEGFRRMRRRRFTSWAPAQPHPLRTSGPRPTSVVAKSVFAAFAMDWLVGRYAPHVVLVERHPLDVVASWMRLGFVVGDLATRERIRSEHIEPFRLPPWNPALPRLLQVSWAVGVLTSAFRRQARTRLDWKVVSYEEIARDRSRLRGLAASVGLGWSADAEAHACSQDGVGSNPLGPQMTSEARQYLWQFPELAPWLASPVPI